MVELVVRELWVYPVKACQGVKVHEAELDAAGLRLDRAFSVVDALGKRFCRNEALSARKLPELLKIATRLEGDMLVISAPGQPEVVVPLAHQPGLECVAVSCSGTSTTQKTDGDWELGELEGVAVSEAADRSLTAFLNSTSSGPKTEYRLVRTFGSRKLREYPPAFPLLERCAEEARFRESESRYHDFAPLLVTTDASCAEVARLMGVDEYPQGSFRANVIVSASRPWEEEEWEEYQMGDLSMCRIKTCPRCVSTLRRPDGEGWVVPQRKALLHKALREAFPDKSVDAEWGSWKGPVFGMFTGFAEAPAPGAKVRVGDALSIKSRDAAPLATSADARGTKQQLAPSSPRWRSARRLLAAVLALVLAILAGRRLGRRRR